MNVRVYTKERCGACGKSFDAELRCPEHRGVRPLKVYLQITGVPGYPSSRQRIFIYPDTKSALTLANFAALKVQIQNEISMGSFDPRKYDAKQTDRLRWKNYAVYYLAALRRRTEKEQGSKGWLSQSAYEDYEQYQRLYLIPYFQETSIRDVERKIAKRFLEDLRSVQTGAPASDTLRAKARDAIRHMLNFAVEEEDIPPLAFEFPEVSKGEKIVRTLDSADQDSIIAAAPNHARHILRWLKATGRRLNEARALKVRDVDFRRGEYSVNGAFDMETYKPFPKVAGTSGTVFPMDAAMADIVRSALAGRVYGPDDFVFINPHAQSHYTARALNNVFDRAKKKAGFPQIELNEFGRHSWATQRIVEGWSYDQVAMFLLNSPEVVRKRYAKVTKATRVAVIEIHRGKRPEVKAK